MLVNDEEERQQKKKKIRCDPTEIFTPLRPTSIA